MHLQDIHLLYEYNYWAKNRLMGVVETLTREQFTKDLGTSHTNIHGTMVHILGAEEIWLNRWNGISPPGLPTPAQIPTLEAVRDRWNTIEKAMVALCNTLQSDADLMSVRSYKDIKGNSYSHPLYQMMQHLVNHSTYHRGQITAMLRQLGVQPASTDLIGFYREKAVQDNASR